MDGGHAFLHCGPVSENPSVFQLVRDFLIGYGAEGELFRVEKNCPTLRKELMREKGQEYKRKNTDSHLFFL